MIVYCTGFSAVALFMLQISSIGFKLQVQMNSLIKSNNCKLFCFIWNHFLRHKITVNVCKLCLPPLGNTVQRQIPSIKRVDVCASVHSG